jgi:hypothetical protein
MTGRTARVAALGVLLALAGASACSSSGDDEGKASGSGASSGSGATSGSGGAGAAGSGATSGSGGAGATGSGGTGGASGGGGSGGSSAGHDCKNPHPSWLFCEDFEGMSAGFDAWRASFGWTDHIGAANPGRMTSSTDAHTGGFAVHFPAAASAGYQGADLIFRTCDGANKTGCALKSYDKLHFRTYLKLAPDHQRVHHFLSIAGSQQYWDAYGNAGCRPSGQRHMGTTVDFKATSHETFFYTYFPEMKCDPGATCDKYASSTDICAGCAQKGMPCSNGPECCWGNHFEPSPAVALPLGKWVCLEMMMKANDVGQKNGEMAYFIDGKLAHQETSMSFRTTAALGLNMVRLQHYLETSDAKSHSNQVWFDDVVVSTEPIGCQ